MIVHGATRGRFGNPVDDFVDEASDRIAAAIEARIRNPTFLNDMQGYIVRAGRNAADEIGDGLIRYMRAHRSEIQAEVANIDIAGAIPTKYKFLAATVGAAAVAGAVFGFLAWRRRR